MEGIKAGDLRLKNWIAVKHSNTPEEVFSIQWQIARDGQLCTINGLLTEYVYGIPLNEEWLKRFGFEIDKSLTNNITAKLPIHENRQLLIKSGLIADDGLENFWVGINGHIANVKFVHQLMNIYYALTGTELTINKP